jgi:aryl-alcohol dehydrogenase-like predicted oxidoreductase
MIQISKFIKIPKFVRALPFIYVIRQYVIVLEMTVNDIGIQQSFEYFFGYIASYANLTMEKLGVEKIQTVLLHNERHVAEYGDVITDIFREIKEEGLVGEFGISFSDKTHLLDYTADPIYTAVQIPMNLLDSAEIRNGSIKKLRDRGVTVYVRSLYLQGLFFKDVNTLPEKLSSVGPILDELRLVAKNEGISMASLALSYLKDAQGIDSLVIGCETPEQLVDNLRGLELTLTDAELEAMNAVR